MSLRSVLRVLADFALFRMLQGPTGFQLHRGCWCRSQDGHGPHLGLQSINVINGRPSWKSEFISGAIQGCGRFDFTYAETKILPVVASVPSGEEVRGVKITLEMAKAKVGPQHQVAFNASTDASCSAEFFWQLYIPDILNGMSSVEEAEVIEADIKVAPSTAEDKLDKVPWPEPIPLKLTLCQSLEPEPVSDVTNPTIFLTDEQLAERWQCHRQTLIRWRTRHWPKFSRSTTNPLQALRRGSV